ncbi:MAG: histidine kinase N-terminal 7TM domain-containing protein, partial [Gemmatimonadales bacterium]
MLIQAVVLPTEDPMVILVKVGGILLFGLTAVLIGRLREVREAPFVAAALGVVALWRACQFGVILGSPAPVALFFMSMGQAAVAFIPPSLLLGQAVGSGLLRPNRRNVLLLYSVAVVNVVLVATNAWHGLVWTHPPLRDGLMLKRPDYGLWFNWIYTPFSYTLVVLALVAALFQLWSPIQVFRRQAALFLVSVTLPFANNIIFTYGGTPPNQMTTDLVFLGSGMLWAFGLLRLQLYRMSPMAQEAILSSITDGVLILGTADTLVDINPAARNILGLDHRAALGRPAEQALAGQPELIALSQNADPCSIVFRTLGGRTVEAEVRPVDSSLGSIGGKLLVLRDTTERLQAQRELQAREALLKTIVDNSPNGILTARPCGGEAGWPRDFECVQANPAAHRYLGLERLQGLRLSETPLVHKALLVQLLRSTVLRQETASVVIDAPAQGRWFQLVSSPAGADALVTLVDITDQKTREEHISTIA